VALIIFTSDINHIFVCKVTIFSNLCDIRKIDNHNDLKLKA